MSDRIEGGTVFRDGDELMTDPPAKLTKRGLAMLTEIWEVAGRPAKPKPKRDDDGTFGWMVGIDDLKSHHGTDAKQRSAARIRTHLIEGGYLNIIVWQNPEEATTVGGGGIIDEIGLSLRGFDALIEAGVIKTAKRRPT